MRVAAIIAGLLLCAGRALGAEKAIPLPSLVRSGGFEQATAGRALPDGWDFFISRQAKASAEMDAQVRHSGARALRFNDASPAEAHVYGRFVQSVAVEPETTYRLTVWARGRGVGGGIHFTDWKTYTLSLPAGDFEWRESSTTLITQPDQRALGRGVAVRRLPGQVGGQCGQLPAQTGESGPGGGRQAPAGARPVDR